MKKILLLAYTNVNFGDDMFIKTICMQFPKQKFVLEAPEKYKEIFGDVSNLEIKTRSIYREFYVKVNRKLIKNNIKLFQKLSTKKYKAVVYVVGGLFDEDDIWHDNINRYGLQDMKNQLLKYAFIESTPFFLLGCNMTRVKTEEYIEQMKFVFEDLRDICFRDVYSYNLFKELTNTRYSPDIVFNYKCNNEVRKSKTVVISIWGALTQGAKLKQWKWAENLWDAYMTFILEAVKYFLSQDVRICLLSLCEAEGDLEACENIINRVENRDSVILEHYNGNLSKIISLFEEAEFVIGTRFHSLIMAINAGCAFYPIVYESKTMQLLNDIHYNGTYSHIEHIESYSLENLIASYEKKQVIECKKIKEEAKSQFDILSEIILEKDFDDGKE